MTNKEKFLQLVSDEDNNTLKEIKQRIKNRAMLRESQQIAIKVLMKLDELGWSQKDLAQKMGVSPQQITKIVSGKENLTIETQIKLQNILDIPVLASYYENKEKGKGEFILNVEKQIVNVEKQFVMIQNDYHEIDTIKSVCSCFFSETIQPLA
ncbi:MAG TPA: helix-turn-helix transcriptional regulator [Bacteroidales bacterium]|nr:helix-turn-helix transcriptional regulator [Bacteroidales bacterium]HPS71117.1 helix-turn-helix transcriptional regulator [Bacteroidales bacterium]